MDEAEVKKGFVVGAGLLLGELSLFALFLAGEAVTSEIIMALLNILVSAVSFLQSAIVGYKQSGEFLVGFFFGGSFALWLAGEISNPMGATVTGGIIMEIIGVVVGSILRMLEQ